MTLEFWANLLAISLLTSSVTANIVSGYYQGLASTVTGRSVEFLLLRRRYDRIFRDSNLDLKRVAALMAHKSIGMIAWSFLASPMAIPSIWFSNSADYKVCAVLGTLNWARIISGNLYRAYWTKLLTEQDYKDL